MSILDRIATARDDAFAGRVAMILAKLCYDISNEDAGASNHANRIAFAWKHLKAETNSKAIAAFVIASNATIQAEIDGAANQRGGSVPDGDIEYALAGLFNFIANAYAAA